MPENSDLFNHEAGVDVHPASTPEPGLTSRPLRVVGIGGSAGALDDYERFFLGLPPVTGMAFVVVTHLDPSHRGLMPSLLGRCTTMPVVQAEDGMALQPNRVYVIPPAHTLDLRRGTLHLGNLEQAEGRVIDLFFQALAADQGERAVAVVLSGMGSDGTRGARAVKASGGQVLVEHPSTAEYPSMPESVVATRLADAVQPVDELASALLSLNELVEPLRVEDLMRSGSQSGAPLERILQLIRSHSGHNFMRYKRNTLVRRINRRMQGHRMTDVLKYIELLESSPDETDALFQDFTINVTSFFRDAEAFEALKAQLRGYIQNRVHKSEPFRVWVTACSTGEEAYSVAIVLHELAEELGERTGFKVQIFATDIDQKAVDVARLGRYPRDIAYTVSPERLSRFFFPTDGHYQVRADLRETVIFATHTTFGDPPFTRLDLLCCRNMLIYVGQELQQQIMGLFLYALKPGGLLFLGSSETVGRYGEQFTALNSRWKIYRRGEGPAAPLGLGYFRGEEHNSRPAIPARVPAVRDSGLDREVHKVLLRDHTPPAVVVDEQGEVLFVHGRTARYLEFPQGQLQSNVFEMIAPGLRYELRSAVHEAFKERRDVTRKNLRIGTGETLRRIDLTVQPIGNPGPGPVIITFGEAVEAPRGPAISLSEEQVLTLETELRHSRESLQATLEEMAVSMEELRSSNEAFQTTNEELQSANEELMTSKEELQSLNEELTTVNAEHLVVIQEQEHMNDDYRNLMESAGTATVFLSSDLRIRRFTPLIEKIVKLNKSDAGRPLLDFNINLRYTHLVEDITRVLRTLEPFEVQVQTQNGEWYLMRINPYRTTDHHIDGVVVAFTSIELIKSLEWRLVQSLTYAESVLDRLQDPLVILQQHLEVVTASRALLELLSTQLPSLDASDQDGAGAGFDLPELRRRLKAVIAAEEPLAASLMELGVSQQTTRRMKQEAEEGPGPAMNGAAEASSGDGTPPSDGPAGSQADSG